MPPICEIADMTESYKATLGSFHHSFNKNMTLNDAGLKLFTQCTEKFNLNEVKGTIDNYFTVYCYSGFDKLQGTRFENFQMCGTMNGAEFKSSIVILMDYHKQWVLTKSGSLYKLNVSALDAAANISP
jgi:hypothetical protein